VRFNKRHQSFIGFRASAPRKFGVMLAEVGLAPIEDFGLFCHFSSPEIRRYRLIIVTESSFRFSIVQFGYR